ncbi:MAG: phosphoribosylformylglycinamidine synthase [Desulfobacterales bacterium]|nr:MAG: phosphoribosylformylglycinamidine synthase [Desulfobacterales bacterium]
MSDTNIRALVLTGFGLNCDMETAHTCELAGAKAERVHINALIDRDVRLADYQIMIFGGGFSWGDDHGAGVVQAVRMKTGLGDDLLEFVARDHLIIGICNGFQTLVNLGLLPGLDSDYTARKVALIGNDTGNFRNDWVRLIVDPASACVFTRGISQIDLPVRHGEGKFYTDAHTHRRLAEGGQIVLRYALSSGSPAKGAWPENPNGSLDDIAGICDPTGRILGLMPHPEGYHDPSHHPDWPLRREMICRGRLFPSEPAGLRIFRNAVRYFSR